MFPLRLLIVRANHARIYCLSIIMSAARRRFACEISRFVDRNASRAVFRGNERKGSQRERGIIVLFINARCIAERQGVYLLRNGARRTDGQVGGRLSERERARATISTLLILNIICDVFADYINRRK